MNWRDKEVGLGLEHERDSRRKGTMFGVTNFCTLNPCLVISWHGRELHLFLRMGERKGIYGDRYLLLRLSIASVEW